MNKIQLAAGVCVSCVASSDILVMKIVIPVVTVIFNSWSNHCYCYLVLVMRFFFVTVIVNYSRLIAREYFGSSLYSVADSCGEVYSQPNGDIHRYMQKNNAIETQTGRQACSQRRKMYN